MGRVERQTWSRVGVALAVALVAHLWMLDAPGAVDLFHPIAVTVVLTSHPLPVSPSCPMGMSACRVSDPDTRSPAAILLSLVGRCLLPDVFWADPHTEGVRPSLAGIRDERSPPQPPVASTAVLLE